MAFARKKGQYFTIHPCYLSISSGSNTIIAPVREIFARVLVVIARIGDVIARI